MKKVCTMKANTMMKLKKVVMKKVNMMMKLKKVNMKKVNEATSMYPMYSITDTPRVITIFVVIYTTAAVWSARGGRLARGAGRGRRAEGVFCGRAHPSTRRGKDQTSPR